MPLSRDFKQTIQSRAARDPQFRRELLREGVECMLAGEVEIAKAILRDFINATVGFPELAAITEIPAKSLMRMFGAAGNPRAANLLRVLEALQRRERVRLRVRAASA